jgi:hypothetical protein
MNIVSVKHFPGQEDYLLKEDEMTVLKLCYKQELHTARIETEKERRVLIIDDEGLLKTKLILKNEYGVRIGQLMYDNFSDSKGTVEIENKQFRFSLKNTSFPELSIYKNLKRSLLYSCLLSFNEKNYGSVNHEKDHKNFKTQISSLIIAISRYLFLKDGAKEKQVFNEAVIF